MEIKILRQAVNEAIAAAMKRAGNPIKVRIITKTGFEFKTAFIRFNKWDADGKLTETMDEEASWNMDADKIFVGEGGKTMRLVCDHDTEIPDHDDEVLYIDCEDVASISV